MPTPMAFLGAIFDVDGVLVDSPHAQAWQEALRELMEGEWRDIRPQSSYTPERFTLAVYQQMQAGKPRLTGARAALDFSAYRTLITARSATRRSGRSTWPG